jgi:cysteinyl-tRNA synthetase
MLKLYNTLTKQIEEIKKPEGRRLNMYSCGPTIYNYAHIGNLRSFILADLLYRTLKYDGYEPRWVMNLTDIDDKTIKGTIQKFGKAAGVKELFDFTEEYRLAFVNDLKEVNVMVDEIEFIRITNKMPEIQEFIMQLIAKGYAYKAEDGSTYFSIEKYQKDFGDYGQLVGEKFIEGKKVGARVAVDEYEKDNLSDFALWKAYNPESDGNIAWDHPELGKGRPGWHIECSVINKVAFNGEPTDIHTGGVDLIFPHHTNEIAQSQALVGKGNFVHHWLHSEHLLVDGKKMSKSLGNFYTLKDIFEKGFNGMDFRFLFFNTNYRAQQNFTFESLNASKVALERSCQNKNDNFNLKPSERARMG